MSEILSDYTGEVKPEVVEINGVRLGLKEFDMRTRAAWLDVAKEYDLAGLQSEIQTKVIPKIANISQDVETDPRVKSVQARIDKLQEKHDKIMDVYATDDEPEDVDEQLEAVVVRMEKSADELNRIIYLVQEEVMGEAKMAEKKITELMEVQDKARVDFIWRMARAMGKTEEEFEEFYARCDSEDYQAADRFIHAGNAPWASLYTDRMQEKPKKTKQTN